MVWTVRPIVEYDPGNSLSFRRDDHMKRLLAFLLAASLLIGLLPATAMADTQYASVIGGWLRLRSTAGYAENNVITSYYTGTVVEILGKTGEWYQVKTPDGRTGYMLDDFLQLGASVPEASANGYVTSHNGYGVRMRKGPGTGYRVIAKYDVGTPVKVLESGTYWCKINVNGLIGYMMSQFIRQSSDAPAGTEAVLGYATVWSANGYGVRLRTGPGTGYGKIGVYSVGTQVAILEKGAEWDRIQVGGRVGYMKNEFLHYYSTNEVTSVSINTLNPEVGTVMSVQALTPSSASVSYEWMVGGTVKGTNATYTVTAADANQVIQLKVTGTGSYTGSAVSSATNKVIASNQISSVKLNTTAPVTGTTLQATVKPEGATVTYVWTVDDVTVTSATGSTYTVQAADVGKVVQVTVTGTGNYTGTASAATAQVMASASVSGVSITTSSGAAPTVGDTLNASVSPAQATVTYQWLRDGGAISGATGASYVLTSADEGKKISVTVTGTGAYAGSKTSEQTAAVAAAPTAPVIGAYAMPAARVGDVYATQLTAQGGGAISWSLKSGSSLPAGLALSATGAITGTPTMEGSVTFTVLAQNSAGTGEATFTIAVAAQASPMLTVGAITFADAVEGYAQPAAAAITITNTGDADATLTGLTAENADGTLSTAFAVNTNGSSVIKAGETNATWNVQPVSGLAAGTYTAVFKAYYDRGAVAQANLSFTVTAAAPAPVAPEFITNSFGDATVGVNYARQLEATGDTPILWSIIGLLPEGMTLDYQTGVISGTPTMEGTYAFSVAASNQAGTVNKNFTLTVLPAAPAAVAPTIETAELTDATAGAAYSITIAASGTASITWSDNGALPEGLTLSSDGIISGTPVTAGTYSFKVTAQNEAGSDEKEYTLKVWQKPSITTNFFGPAMLGEGYGRTLEATGDQPITWKISSGNLPTGLTLNATNGTITGTPTVSGEFTFTVVAENKGGTDEKTFSIEVDEPAAVTFTFTVDGVDIAEYAEGETVTCTAAEGENPFKGWYSNDINVSDVTSSTLTFTMPASNVSVTTLYEDTPEVKAPVIEESVFAPAIKGEAYSHQFIATGDQPITWTISEGEQPTGLTLNETTGLLEGTLSAAGKFSFMVSASNGGGKDYLSCEIEVADVLSTQTMVYDATLDGMLLGSFEPGEVVTVSASEDGDKAFTGWKTDGIELADPESATVSFKMPENSVSFQAQYEEKKVATTLSKPEFILITGTNEVSWNGVDGAEEYALYVDLASGGQTDEFYTVEWGYVLNDDLQPGDTVYVKAVGNGDTVLDSDYTSKTFE